MARFNVPRASRNQEGYTEKLVFHMHSDQRVVFKQGYGVYDINPEMIVDSFQAVRNTYCKINLVKVHYMELFIEREAGLAVAVELADWFGRFLYGNGFQAFVSVMDMESEYAVAVALNAVSYVDGHLFHDNNACYNEIFQHLCRRLQVDWELDVTVNTFFDPKRPEGNYVHGVHA